MFKISHNLNGKIIFKYKNDNLHKISVKKYQLLLFKRPSPIPYFYPLFIVYQTPTPREANKIHNPPT